MHDIGSSATLANITSSPQTDGAYVIPTAMIRKNGYILAWEFFASKVGPIRIQVRLTDTIHTAQFSLLECDSRSIKLLKFCPIAPPRSNSLYFENSMAGLDVEQDADLILICKLIVFF